ncbi:long-chain fatty acid--CoA ligase [Parashewanella spongiae]|uniref:Long-chain fatty acid--CoA ligase n=2 Tax=Parashewanella spongiae TaxID=342950 RepID=A0A3A6TGK9_9GAMM|nr:class I adenylate-forming enzyme family protein [Parashewanella spongiae]MCL1079316.1 acyl--CoA ligase [Parashewanella spongiae]RJY10411.1 long-chain fatty acid--CoA ligase [Parashewanella spongiae]
MALPFPNTDTTSTVIEDLHTFDPEAAISNQTESVCGTNFSVNETEKSDFQLSPSGDFFRGIGGIDKNTGQFNWSKVPWFELFNQQTQDLINKHPSITDALKATGFQKVTDIWRNTIQESGELTAVSSEFGSLNYAEVEQITKTLAHNLRSFDSEPLLKAGDKVLLPFPSTPELLVAMIGVIDAGLTPVPILFTLDETKLLSAMENALKLTGAKMVMGMGLPSCVSAMQALKEKNSELHFVVGELAAAQKVKTVGLTFKSVLGRFLGKVSPVPEGFHSLYSMCQHCNHKQELITPKSSLLEPAIVLLTSGTTGKSKAIELTHEQLLILSIQLKIDILGNPEVQLSKNPHIYFPLPLGHAFGAGVSLVLTPSVQGHIILVTNPRDPKSLIQPLKSGHPEVLMGVAKIYDVLIKKVPDELTRLYANTPPSLVVSGAAAMPEVTRNNVERHLHTKVREGFGMSETGIASALQVQNNPKQGYIPMAGNTYCILDSNQADQFTEGFNPFDLLTDGEGDLMLAGNVSSHYLQQEDKTQETFIKDKFGRQWVRTGDTAKQIGEKGEFEIIGRNKEIIIVNGANYNPDEIDNTIKGHPRISESMVFRLPKDLSDQAGSDLTVLLIKISGNVALSDEDVQGFMRGNHAHEAVIPREGCIIRLPKNVMFPQTDTAKPKRVHMTNEIIRMLEEQGEEGKVDTNKLQSIVEKILSVQFG